MVDTDKNEQEFVADPTGHMFAVVDQWANAQQAEQALLGEHFEEVHVYRGWSGAHQIDSGGEEHGLANHILRLIQHGLTNKDDLKEYEEAARQGASVISFRVDGADGRRERAVQILESAGAREINHFGSVVVETIKP